MFYSPYIGNVIIPTDFHSMICQRGRYAINQIRTIDGLQFLTLKSIVWWTLFYMFKFYFWRTRQSVASHISGCWMVNLTVVYVTRTPIAEVGIHVSFVSRFIDTTPKLMVNRYRVKHGCLIGEPIHHFQIHVEKIQSKKSRNFPDNIAKQFSGHTPLVMITRTFLCRGSFHSDVGNNDPTKTEMFIQICSIIKTKSCAISDVFIWGLWNRHLDCTDFVLNAAQQMQVLSNLMVAATSL